jgi:hypothetical protein
MRVIATTKYVGPTNHKGARVRVRVGARKPVFVSWPYELDGQAAHIHGVREACAKLAIFGAEMASSVVLASKTRSTCYCLPDANDDAYVIILESPE